MLPVRFRAVGVDQCLGKEEAAVTSPDRRMRVARRYVRGAGRYSCEWMGFGQTRPVRVTTPPRLVYEGRVQADCHRIGGESSCRPPLWLRMRRKSVEDGGACARRAVVEANSPEADKFVGPLVT